MFKWLGSYDIDVLRSLIRGERWDIASCHRVRLELMGLVVDGANGLRLTVDGVKASSASATCPPESSGKPVRRLDGLGRRRPSMRP